jgi:hypothetical protein
MTKFGFYTTQGEEPKTTIYDLERLIPVRGEYVPDTVVYGDKDYDVIPPEDLIVLLTSIAPKYGYTIQEAPEPPVLSTDEQQTGVFFYHKTSGYCQYYYFYFPQGQ